jgi:hypothetical protein
MGPFVLSRSKLIGRYFAYQGATNHACDHKNPSKKTLPFARRISLLPAWECLKAMDGQESIMCHDAELIRYLEAAGEGAADLLAVLRRPLRLASLRFAVCVFDGDRFVPDAAWWDRSFPVRVRSSALAICVAQKTLEEPRAVLHAKLSVAARSLNAKLPTPRHAAYGNDQQNRMPVAPAA